MSFPPYPSYQDSGNAWMGRIPEHWRVLPLKRDLTFLTSGSRGWAEHYAEDGALFLRIGNLTRDGLALDLSDIQRVTVPPGTEGERTRVQPGDVLFSITAFMGSVAVVPDGIEPAYVSQHVALARLRRRALLPRWVGYFTLSAAGKAYLEAQCYGGTKIQLSLDDVADLPLPLPPLGEQVAIIAFLDRETGKIDALVAEQERLIALLKEKRQAVISHAVTKGLDASAPMKDSGVAWLGQVPVHWEVVPSTWLFAEGRERAHADDQQLSATQKYGVIPQAEFELLEGRQVTHALMHLDQRKHVEVDNFVISMRSFEGGIERVKSRGCVRSSYIALIGQEKAKPSYFSYVFKSKPYIQGLQTTANFVRDGQDLNYGNFRQVPLPLPPGEEQENIAAFLDFEANRADALATEAHRAIALLRERRATLISAAVTGKIDVRGLATVPAESAVAA